MSRAIRNLKMLGVKLQRTQELKSQNVGCSTVYLVFITFKNLLFW